MVLQPSQVNGNPLNGLPPAVFERGLEKMKAREHYWIATVLFEMPDDNLKGDSIILDPNNIQGQIIRCVICNMPWKKGREGRICRGE